MSDIAPVSGLSVDRLDAPGGVQDRAPARTVRNDPTERPSDRVDISERARFLNKLASLPPTRRELIDRVQKQIAAGTYDTPDKLDQAMSSLLDDLGDI